MIRSLVPVVRKVASLEGQVERLSQADMREKMAAFKKAIAAEEATLEAVLPEVFALVREASKRATRLRPFDVQVLGGLVLHRGKIAEMATGEGKTLVATLPASLNALEGKGVFIVTVNDYLARRDRDWMGPIYEYLGLTVGAIQAHMEPRLRQREYGCDITYGTNSEFGFDYLRDHMKVRVEDQVQRFLNYAIVDEVDSILIDEARTPLIISGPAEESSERYLVADRLARRLRPELHFEVKEKEHQALLTDEGIEEAERIAGVDTFYSGRNMDWPHLIETALRAHHLYRNERDYVVKEGEIIIVDEFTGRLMHGRRWSDGLHQAVEAKEGIRPREENQTLATITYQNYFRLFRKLAGMTGTAMTEAAEFAKIYDLDVVQVPPNRPMRRANHDDVVYRTEPEKWKAISNEIAEVHKKGQPLLVGTISIEKSEKLSGMLSRRGVPHQVLNAKYHEREAQIVAQAGRKGAVTVATNMAGRGTDILLGGNPEGLLRDRLAAEGIEMTDPRVPELRSQFEALAKAEHDEVVSLGGLYVLGTERHDARRIDNQLRGRTGRQGDPGESRFFLSLEDDLMRKFYRDWVKNFMKRLGMEEDQDIRSGMVTRAIERAQKKVEQWHFEARKNVLEYDEVMDKQRRLIYASRQEVLEAVGLKEKVLDMAEEQVESAVALYGAENDWAGLAKWAKHKFGFEVAPETLKAKGSGDRAGSKDGTGAKAFLLAEVARLYEEREKAEGSETMRKIERYLLMSSIDAKWKDHLYAMDALKSGIGLRGYAQVDPKNEYKREGFGKFEQLLAAVGDEVTNLIFKVRIAGEDERRLGRAAAPAASAAPAPVGASATIANPQVARAAAPGAAAPRNVPPHLAFDLYQRSRAAQGQATAATAPKEAPPAAKAADRAPGRNDPCPCGSGKKYKKCCGSASGA
ncbi:MAG: preprotein translocase subunit SecA [Planctomycetes bacterium]|nr:preprotein translocase subunit SecA [Planctomycetota bacterium]